jgi:hypothetical protein
LALVEDVLAVLNSLAYFFLALYRQVQCVFAFYTATSIHVLRAAPALDE